MRSIHIHIHIYIYVYMNMNMYIYIYIHVRFDTTVLGPAHTDSMYVCMYASLDLCVYTYTI